MIIDRDRKYNDIVADAIESSCRYLPGANYEYSVTTWDVYVTIWIYVDISSGDVFYHSSQVEARLGVQETVDEVDNQRSLRRYRDAGFSAAP